MWYFVYFKNCARKIDVLILYVHLFWRLHEDGDLSLKHVGEFMLTDNL